MTITISRSAQERISEILEKEKMTDGYLRLSVDGGGCQGFSYSFDLTDKVNEDDQLFGSSNQNVVIDEASLPFLDGATLVWVSDLSGEFFRVDNPNASSSCGCGTSFSI